VTSARLPTVLESIGLVAASVAWLMAVPGFKEYTWVVAGSGFVVSLTGLALALARRLSGARMAIVVVGFVAVAVALVSPIWQLHSGLLADSTHAHFIWEIGHLH
jgi:hypothetical protein